MAERVSASPAPSVVILGGPTASGKSALALALAEDLDGVVINADSMQVYRDLCILTARPSDDETARLPHRLYGVLDAGDVCSVARWRGLAVAAIEAAHAAGKRAIIVGGTGLYLRALMTGLADVPEIPEAIRRAARERHASVGAAAFHAALAERDPVMAARLAPGDSQRVVRAWEVLAATGRSLADWQADAPAADVPYSFQAVLLLPPRASLYADCDSRFAAMLAAGALEEVRHLQDRIEAGTVGADAPLLKALGVPELRAHLRGEMTLEAAAIASQQATRRFAKRQMTWFRHQVPARAEPPLLQVFRREEKYSFEIYQDILSKIS